MKEKETFYLMMHLTHFIYGYMVLWHEWMNECLMTPQHENQIGYWVSEKGKCMRRLLYGGSHMVKDHSDRIAHTTAC